MHEHRQELVVEPLLRAERTHIPEHRRMVNDPILVVDLLLPLDRADPVGMTRAIHDGPGRAVAVARDALAVGSDVLVAGGPRVRRLSTGVTHPIRVVEVRAVAEDPILVHLVVVLMRDVERALRNQVQDVVTQMPASVVLTQHDAELRLHLVPGPADLFVDPLPEDVHARGTTIVPAHVRTRPAHVDLFRSIDVKPRVVQMQANLLTLLALLEIRKTLPATRTTAFDDRSRERFLGHVGLLSVVILTWFTSLSCVVVRVDREQQNSLFSAFCQ